MERKQKAISKTERIIIDGAKRFGHEDCQAARKEDYMKKIPLLIVIAFFLQGCSTYYYLSPDEFLTQAETYQKKGEATHFFILFPSSTWELASWKLCFHDSHSGFRSRASAPCVPKQSLGTRKVNRIF
jgi:hypothetical protein